MIGTDELTDIAVIKVDGAPAHCPPSPGAIPAPSRSGDWIIAAGNPFGLGSSVSAGIVSARGRDIGAGPFDDFLQIDAPINPGNSGGPTFNLDGQVIAVNTAIVSPTGGSVGIGFAIPSDIARKIVAELRDKGHIDRGWLGVAVQDAPQTPGVARSRTSGVHHRQRRPRRPGGPVGPGGGRYRDGGERRRRRHRARIDQGGERHGARHDAEAHRQAAQRRSPS